MNSGHMAYCASDDWRALVHETILPVALRGVELGDDAIEIGPGPGFTTDVLRTMTSHLTAIELDEGLAASLARRLAGGNVDVVVGDATALDFAAESFTGAASFHMLHHIAPAAAQDRTFAELARVLVPGGVLVAADGTYSEGSAAFHEGDTYNPIDPGELEGRLAAAGFGTVEVRTYDLGWVCTARAG
jgi:SAM-dependent methyltransferase